MINVSTNLNTLKTKVDDLDVGKIKTVPVELKQLSDVVDKQVVKNRKFNTLNTKVNNLEKKCWCNYFNLHKPKQHSKQNLEKKNWRCW